MDRSYLKQAFLNHVDTPITLDRIGRWTAFLPAYVLSAARTHKKLTPASFFAM